MKKCALLVFTNWVNLIFAISPLRSWRLGGKIVFNCVF
jgi:hypothetical protein